MSSIHEYPSFAAFVRFRRMSSTSLSVRRSSIAAGLPESTWGSLENGQFPHPTPAKLHAIARVMGIRPYPLMLMSSAHESGIKRLGGIVLEKLSVPSRWWNLRGGEFIRLARENASRDYETAVKNWQERWPAISVLNSVTAWKTMESEGIVPRLPPPPSNLEPKPGTGLETLSGAWLWSLLAAAIGDPEQAYYLLPGFMYVMGRAGDRRTAQMMDETAAWTDLSQAYTRCYTRSPESFDNAAYFAVAADVAEAMRAAAAIETSAQRLARITAVWDGLSREQQEHVVAITEDLAKSK